MNQYQYSIRFDWDSRVETPAELSQRYLKTIQILTRTGSAFDPWYTFDVKARKEIPWPTTNDKIISAIKNNVVRGDQNEPSPLEGYHITSGNNLDTTPTTISLNITGGSKISNDGVFEIGGYKAPSDISLVTYSLFKPTLLTLVQEWEVNWACAQIFWLDYQTMPTAPGVPPVPYSIFHVPWFCYLSAPMARGLRVPPEIATQIVPGGGLMLETVRDRLDPADPDHMRLARALAQVLIGQRRQP
jgi:hypothetical protein